MQEIKNTTKKSKTNNFAYELFDIGSKAIVLDDTKQKDVFKAIDELSSKRARFQFSEGYSSMDGMPAVYKLVEVVS